MRTLILAASVALACGGLDAAAAAAPAPPAPQLNSASGVISTNTTAAANVGTAAGATSIPETGANAATATNATSTPDVSNSAPRFGPGSTFANDSGNSALGTSPGQSSSGTAAGNSGTGIGATSSATLGTNGTIGVVGGTAALNPDGTVAVVPGGGTAGVVTSLPSNAAASQAPSYTILNTPLFDQVAREGREKEARRRARGEEPRVYGIAPRTDNDLTWQMPDDRIIRY
jgi:hypothetical protein